MSLLATRISKGVDSAGHPSGAALVAAGIGVQCVYVAGAFAVTDAELADYLAHGIWCVALFEIRPDAASGGLGAGQTDMGQAIKAVLARHIPIGAALVLCDDTSAIPYPTVEAYWRGGLTSAHISGFKAGGYGPHAYCTQALAAKAIDVAMVAGAWENGQPQTGIAIKQHVDTITVGGVQCDVDDILLPDAPGLLWNTKGLYVPPPAPKPPAPKPSPSPAPQPASEDGVLHSFTTPQPLPKSGRTILDTSVAWGDRLAATPQTEDGATSTARCQWTNAAGKVRLVIEGTPGQHVTVDVNAKS